MKDIFISYSRKDGSFAYSLSEALKTLNLEAWLDVDDIPPAARWRPEIASAIESHGSFGFVISPDSLQSGECLKELEHAVECGKRLIPIRYRAVDDKNVPKSLGVLNWTFFDDKDSFDESVDKLVLAIQTDLEWNRDLSRLLVQARRWDTRQRETSFLLRGVELQDALQLLARAEMGKTPPPTALQEAFIEASKLHEASEIQRWKEKLYEANYNLAKAFEERAIGALAKAEKSGNENDYKLAWLCSLAAVSKDIGPDRTLPESVGRLMLPELRTNAFRELWRTQKPTELVQESFSIPPGEWDSGIKQHEWLYTVPSGPIGNVAFEKGGSRLALLCGDNAVRIWSTLEGVESQRLVHKPFTIDSWNASMQLSDSQMTELLDKVQSQMTVIAFATVERLMASGLSDGRILLWDSVEGDAVAELTGHKKPISSIAFHPDGQSMAAASEDGLVSLWLIAGLNCIRHVEFQSVNSLAFSPDGAMLAVGSEDRFIRLLDARNLELQATLEGHTDAVISLSISPDGATLASASKDHTVRLWDLQSPGKQILDFTGHTSAVNDVVFNADGKWLASGGADRTVRLWDIESGASVGVLTGHQGSVVSVAFCPTCPHLASVSNDHSLCLWQFEESRLLARWSGHLSTVNAVAISPKGDRVASGAGDETIRLWDAMTGEELTVLSEHKEWVTSLAFSPDGKLLASGSRDHDIRLWDADSGEALALLKGHKSSVWCLAFSPDGSLIASGSGDSDDNVGGDHTIRLWSIESREEIAVLRGHESDVSRLAFYPDGKYLVSCSGDHFNPHGEDHSVRLWNIASQNQKAVLPQQESAPRSLAVHPNGETFAVGFEEGTIRSFSLEGTVLGSLTGHNDAITALAFSPDGEHLASGSRDSTIRIWRDHKGDEAQVVLTGHDFTVTGLDFSSDSRFLVSGSRDRSVRFWDVAGSHRSGLNFVGYRIAFDAKGELLARFGRGPEIRLFSSSSGEELVTLRGPSEPARDITISPDGACLASSSTSGVIYLWDIHTAKEKAQLEDNPAPLFAMSFSPDGRHLALIRLMEVDIWDVVDAKVIQRIPLPEEQIIHLVHSPDLRFLAATVKHMSEIILVDRQRDDIVQLEGHRDYPLCLAASHNSRWFASGSLDRTIRLWDVVSRKGSPPLRGHQGFVRAIAFSSDDKRLVSGCETGDVRLWDVESCREVLVLPGTKRRVISVAFSPDGGLMASGSEGGEVRLWECNSGREVACFHGHSTNVYVSFSPDGLWLVTHGDSIRLWNLSQLESFRQNGEAVGRLLSASQIQLSYREEGTRFEAEPRRSQLTPVGDFLFPGSESETAFRSRRPGTDPVDWLSVQGRRGGLPGE